MNWDAIGAIGESVGSIAVLITIIYLAVQVRQNNRNTKSVLQQGQSDRVVGILTEWAKPELASVWLEGNGNTPTAESIKELQFAMLCDMLVYDAMDFHHTHLDGLTSEEQFGSVCVGYSNLLQQTGFRNFWASWREARLEECPKFIAWMDSLAATTPKATGSPFV
jgi:hypothetical protein